MKTKEGDKRIKVRVKFTTANISFNEILPFGYETELVSVLSTEDRVIVNDWYRYHDKKHVKIADEVISPAGDYLYSRFVGANGETYTSDIITNMVGYKSFGEIFDKIN